MQINIESIHIGLSYPEHLMVVKSFAIIEQQLLSTENMGVVQREYNKIIMICERVYSLYSEPMIRLRGWTKKRYNQKFFELREAFASEFNAVSDEDFNREGNVYYDLERRYLNEKEFKASNSALN